MNEEIRDLTLEIEKYLMIDGDGEYNEIHLSLRCIRAISYDLDNKILKLEHPEEEKMSYEVKFSQGSAIEFANRYLRDRKDQWMDDSFPRDQIWNVAVEYVLNDIIPFIYGEALD